MISMDEILRGKVKLSDLPQDHRDNLAILLERINKVRAAYGKPMQVTSGYRTLGDHLRIYRELARDHKFPFKDGVYVEAKVPMRSKHLYGLAVDIFDPDKKLKEWILDNVTLMEEIGFWFEDFSVTTNWVHFQVEAPRSGKRFFTP